MSDVIPLDISHRLRCHVCKSNSFEIQLDSKVWMKERKFRATQAVCMECGEGCFDLTTNYNEGEEK